MAAFPTLPGVWNGASLIVHASQCVGGRWFIGVRRSLSESYREHTKGHELGPLVGTNERSPSSARRERMGWPLVYKCLVSHFLTDFESGGLTFRDWPLISLRPKQPSRYALASFWTVLWLSWRHSVCGCVAQRSGHGGQSQVCVKRPVRAALGWSVRSSRTIDVGLYFGHPSLSRTGFLWGFSGRLEFADRSLGRGSATPFPSRRDRRFGRARTGSA